MSEQPGQVLEDAVRLFVAMGRRMGDPGRSVRRDDVWSRATREDHPKIATGAPECQYCPICRTIAATRGSGGSVTGHMVNAGHELLAAMREVVTAYDRSRPSAAPGRRRDGSDGDPIDIG